MDEKKNDLFTLPYHQDEQPCKSKIPLNQFSSNFSVTSLTCWQQAVTSYGPVSNKLATSPTYYWQIRNMLQTSHQVSRNNTHTHNRFMALWILSGTTWVSWY